MPVQDRWYEIDADRVRTPTVRHKKGLRYRAYFVGVDKRQRSKSFDRKLDADRWLEDQASARNSGDWIAPERGRVTVSTVWDSWISTKHLKPSTLDTYERLWANQIKPTFGDKPLGQVAYGTVAEWVAMLRQNGKILPKGGTGPLSVSRTRQAHRVLSMILDHAVSEQRITRNPAHAVEVPKLIARKPHNFLTLEQLVELADECAKATRAGSNEQPMYRTMVLLLGMTGLRWGEMAGLTVADIDPLRRRVNVRRTVSEINGKPITTTPKSGHAREVPLPTVLRDDLLSLCQGKATNEPIFVSPNGHRLRSSNFRRRAYNRAATAIGMPGLVPHELRHTAASLAISSGASIKLVQRMLGHASATMTLDLYGHLYEDELDALSSKLDARFAQRQPIRTSSGSTAPLHANG